MSLTTARTHQRTRRRLRRRGRRPRRFPWTEVSLVVLGGVVLCGLPANFFAVLAAAGGDMDAPWPASRWWQGATISEVAVATVYLLVLVLVGEILAVCGLRAEIRRRRDARRSCDSFARRED